MPSGDESRQLLHQIAENQDRNKVAADKRFISFQMALGGACLIIFTLVGGWMKTINDRIAAIEADRSVKISEWERWRGGVEFRIADCERRLAKMEEELTDWKQRFFRRQP